MAWPREIYVATVSGGVYHTTNFVNPSIQPIWSAINTGLVSLDCTEFHLDPINQSDRQYVLTGANDSTNVLYRRVLGAAWTDILDNASLLSLVSGSHDVTIKSFCCDPSVDGRVWVSLYIMYNVNYPDNPAFGCAYSDDYGDTWHLASVFYINIHAQAIRTIRAYGDNVFVMCLADVGSDYHIYYSTNKGNTFSDEIINSGILHQCFNPLSPDSTYVCHDNFSLGKFTIGGSLVSLQTGEWPTRCDSMWFNPLIQAHQKLIYLYRLYVTTDDWSNIDTVSGADIDFGPFSIAPWAGNDTDQMLLGIPIAHASGHDHGVAALYGDMSTGAVGISGTNCGTPPYTDSIPYTASDVCFNGIEAVHIPPGKIYTHAVAMPGYSDTGLDRGIPMAGDRSAWDAKNYPLRHTNDIDDNGIHWTEAELKSWNLGDFGSDSADDGYVLTADGVGGANWEVPTGGGGGEGGGTEYKMSILTFLGDLTISDNPLRLYNELTTTQTIVEVFLSVGTAPTGDDVIVDIHKNGTTIFTDQAHRPVITAGTNTGTTSTIDIPSWADGDYLTAHVDNIGSTIPGSDLVVHIVTTGVGGGGAATGVNGWASISGTFTYASATTINVSSGAAAIYSKGCKIRFQNNNSGSYLYAYVVGIADTLLTVVGDAVPNATLTDIYYSLISEPVGFPHWFNYTTTPTGITVGAGGTLISRFSLIGTTCTTVIQFVFGTGSAVGGDISFTPPIAANTVNAYIPSVVFVDNGTNTIPAVPVPSSAAALGAYAFNAASTYGVANNTLSTVPFTWATGDSINLQVTYEIA